MTTDRHSPHIPRQQPLLVGRDREQAHLRELLDDAIAGHGSLVLVSGEAGIGKTSLVRWLIDVAERENCLVLTGGCYDLTTTPPYGPWSEAIRDYEPVGDQPPVPSWFGNPEELEKISSQAALFEEARRFFAAIAENRPLVIVLEDLHWADPATLDALRYLARTVDDAAILLVVTYREDEITRRHELFQLLPLLVRESRAQRIHLSRLEGAGVRELVAGRYTLADGDLARLVDHVVARSEGNPFFAEEILQGLEDERVLAPADEGWRLGELGQAHVPSLLRQTIEGRFGRLSGETRSALQAGAVIGHEIRLRLWQAVSGLDEESLDHVIAEALETGVLEETPERDALQFRHALLREALYESLLLSRRRTLHRKAGEALGETDNPDPDAVAHHFRQATDTRELGWLVQAGLRARRSIAWHSAAERFERAAMLLEDRPSHVRERGWLIFYAVFILRDSGESRLFDMLTEAERLATEADDQILSASIRFHRGIRLALGSQVRRGIEELRAATETFESLRETGHIAPVDDLAPAILQQVVTGDTPIPVRVSPSLNAPEGPSQVRTPIFFRCVLATWLATSGQYREAQEIAESINEEMADFYGEDHLRTMPGASGHFALGHAYAATGRPVDSSREFGLASRGYGLFGDPVMSANSRWFELMLVTIPYRADQLGKRSRSISDAEMKWNQTANRPSTQDVRPPVLLTTDLLEGRWAEAQQQARALESAHVVVLKQAGIAALGTLARNQGEPDLAWEQISKLFPEGSDTEPGDSLFPLAHGAQCLAAELALEAGDLKLAREWIDAHGRWQEWSGAVLWRSDHLILQARFHQLAGDRHQADHHARAALECASEPRQPLVQLAAHRLLGELAVQGKRFAEASEHLQRSLELAEDCAVPFEQAQTLLALAELHLATGQPDEAWRRLDQARGICTPLEATPALRRATAIAAQLAVRRGQQAYPGGLTPREVEVLQLVAAGMTNAEAGDQLFISTRTIAQHLRSIYNKLGVDSRVEATRFAVEHGLTDPPTA